MTTAPPPPRDEDDERHRNPEHHGGNVADEDHGPTGVSDEVWQKFVEDSAEQIRAGAPKEPSARAYMVTARLRREDAEAAERRAAEAKLARKARRPKSRWRRAKEPKAWEPEGWRTGPAWREMQRGERRSWRKGARTLLVVVVVGAVTLVAINPSAVRSLVRGHGFSSSDADTRALDSGSDSGGSGSGDDTPLPPETAKPTAAPPAGAPGMPTVSHPFTGSPALRWADGEAGIVVPKAKAVGKVTAAQVATALRTTKAYLVDTNLDPAVLRGGYPTEALRLADPINGAPARIKSVMRSPSSDTIGYVTRYDPAKARLVGKVIKVRGRMTFGAYKYGSVRVHSDVSFVYAFTNAHNSDGTVQRMVVRRVLDTYWMPRSPSGKVQIGAFDTDLAGMACDYSDGYLHPEWDPDATETPTGPTSDPYDRSKPVSTSDECGVVSRI